MRGLIDGHPPAAAVDPPWYMAGVISLDALRDTKTIVVHDFCADGLASALLLQDALPAAELRFVQYGTPAHNELAATPGMLFCDFSPPLERVDEFVRARTIVLDHHKTAEPAVRAMGDGGIFGDEDADPGVCGAVLALRHVWQPLRGGGALDAFAEKLAALAGVRDTWQTHDPRWRAACAQTELIAFLPRDMWLSQPLAEIARTWDADVTRFGEALLAKQDERVTRTLKDALRFTSPEGLRVVAFEGTAISSDAAERLGESADVVVGFGFSIEGDVPKMRFSTRSHTGFDCAAFAQARGGGGHTAAAGFAVALAAGDPQPYAMVRRLFS